MSNHIKQVTAATQKLRELLQNFTDHAQRKIDLANEKAELQAVIDNFLSTTDLPSDEALGLLTSRRTKIEWIDGNLLLLNRQEEGKLRDAATAATQCRAALESARAHEKEVVVAAAEKANKPFAPDTRDPRNGELQTPARDLAASLPIMRYFDSDILTADRPPDDYPQPRRNDPKAWDAHALKYVTSVLDLVEKWKAQKYSFVPADFAK